MDSCRVYTNLNKWSGRDSNPHALGDVFRVRQWLPVSSPDQKPVAPPTRGALPFPSTIGQSSENCLSRVLGETSGGGI